jgi:hypothetical protein
MRKLKKIPTIKDGYHLEDERGDRIKCAFYPDNNCTTSCSAFEHGSIFCCNRNGDGACNSFPIGREIKSE